MDNTLPMQDVIDSKINSLKIEMDIKETKRALKELEEWQAMCDREFNRREQLFSMMSDLTSGEERKWIMSEEAKKVKHLEQQINDIIEIYFRDKLGKVVV